MATIKTNFGEGHANLAPSGQGSPTLATALREIIDDLTALRTAITTLTAKLDAENVTNLDTDYAATCDPAALVSIKG